MESSGGRAGRVLICLNVGVVEAAQDAHAACSRPDRFHAGILPVFCPTGQLDHGCDRRFRHGGKMPCRSKGLLLCMGLFFDSFHLALRSQRSRIA
ncbi:hypothetical protein ABH999_004608 [Bradyrhizobium yuanmingense]|uniref:hypothetical protein n=1 Tax=Bradyrhizobium yuanmingense TaxID=108015 RepID=UPI0012FD2457|nr:hypothetical protein [Bradyrhizobium yuanmingense]